MPLVCVHVLVELSLSQHPPSEPAAALGLFLRDHSPEQLLVSSAPTASPVMAAPLLQLVSNLSLSFPDLLSPRLEPHGDLLLRYIHTYWCVCLMCVHTVQNNEEILFYQLMFYRCCDAAVIATETPPTATPTLHMCRCALDTLHVLISTGSKVILDLLLAEESVLRLVRLLTPGRLGVCVVCVCVWCVCVVCVWCVCVCVCGVWCVWCVCVVCGVWCVCVWCVCGVCVRA